MGWILYEPGDVVGYPDITNPAHKKMIVKDRYIHKYRSGKMYIRYLYEDLLDRLVEEMHANIEKDLDNVVCIWGAEGSGKSVLAYQLAKKFDPDFDIETCYVYSFEDLLERINTIEADEGAIFWMDEATNISNNRDWMRSDNKAFITMLEMFRSRHWTLIMCIPDYNRLDIYLRENRVRFSLHAEWLCWEGARERERGYFHLTRIDTSSGYRLVDKVGYGCFDDIAEEDREIYAKIKKNTQTAKLEEMYLKKIGRAENSKQAEALRALILEKKESGCTVEEIAEQTGLAEQTVMNYCTKARKDRKRKEVET